jgi:pimeloyl-ACP methyl ester carboxylesterase
MLKVLKVLGKALAGILAAIIVFLIGTSVYNQVMLAGEREFLDGQDLTHLVEVDGQKMSVYVSGEGEHTLVFMAGSGDAAPIMSFKDFADRFDGDCRVAIIEKFGYGFSDEFDGSRSVETRVNQERKALQSLGITGPYILCPHSYSGLEAIYWAQNFPDEVEAIAGLDMAVPRAYDSYDDEVISSVNTRNLTNNILNKAGVVRLFVGGSIPEDFTDEKRKTVTALVCKNYGNTTAGNEVKYVAADVAVIDKKPVPDIPTLLIISDGSVTEGWIGFENDYASALTDVTTLQLDCGHGVYDCEPDKCEDAMRTFLAGLAD